MTNYQAVIQRFAAEHNVLRRDIVATFAECGMRSARQRVHYYWTGQRCPEPGAAAVLCVALDLNARQCLELYEACGIPTPDPVWQAVQDAALP